MAAMIPSYDGPSTGGGRIDPTRTPAPGPVYSPPTTAQPQLPQAPSPPVVGPQTPTIPPVPYPSQPPIIPPILPPVAQSWFADKPWLLPVGGGVLALLVGVLVGVKLGRKLSSPSF